MEPTDDIKKCSRYFRGREKQDISMASRQKEIRNMYRAAAQLSVLETIKKSRVNTWFYQLGKVQRF